jgi:putative transcriptional regulator
MFKSLAPGFLLATPHLTDPNFKQTVVLLFAHTAEGAMGVIVNRPSNRFLREVLDSAGLECPEATLRGQRVFAGGPVQSESGWVVFEGDDPLAESFEITETLRVTGSVDVFKALLADKSRGRLMFLLGYAGWSPGQLDAEIESGSWLPVPADPATVFEVPVEDRWRSAYLACGIDPNLWSLTAGDG